MQALLVWLVTMILTMFGWDAGSSMGINRDNLVNLAYLKGIMVVNFPMYEK